MNDQQLRALFDETDLTGQPPLAPDYLPGLLKDARRSARSRRIVAALSAVAVVAALLGLSVLAPPLATSLPPASPASGPSLPDRIAPYSFFTSSVSDAPPGRAVMLYTYGNGELTNVWQALTLGADGDVYRHLDAAGDNGAFQQWLLTPDGGRVILAEKRRIDGALTVVDLTTGGQHEVRLPEPAGVTLLAISPDGRHVAYASAPPPANSQPTDGIAQETGAIASETARVGLLTIIDLVTGKSTPVPGLRPVQAAGFSPDGLRLVVQSALQTWIITRDGQLERQVRLPHGAGIVPRDAWSPDWRTLAITTWRAESRQPLDGTTTGPYVETPGTISVYDLVHGSDVKNDVVRPQKVADGVFLGWRFDGRILALTGQHTAGDEALVEVRVDGGPPTVLSRFDPGSSCELGMQTCTVLDLTVAAGLVPELTVRAAGEPDRGPWPLPLRLLAVAGLTLVATVWWLVWRRARLSRGRSAETDLDTLSMTVRPSPPRA